MSSTLTRLLELIEHELPRAVQLRALEPEDRAELRAMVGEMA